MKHFSCNPCWKLKCFLDNPFDPCRIGKCLRTLTCISCSNSWLSSTLEGIAFHQTIWALKIRRNFLAMISSTCIPTLNFWIHSSAWKFWIKGFPGARWLKPFLIEVFCGNELSWLEFNWLRWIKFHDGIPCSAFVKLCNTNWRRASRNDSFSIIKMTETMSHRAYLKFIQGFVQLWASFKDFGKFKIVSRKSCICTQPRYWSWWRKLGIFRITPNHIHHSTFKFRAIENILNNVRRS